MTYFFRNIHRPNLPEVRTLIMIPSQGGTLRAYPELLTAEPRRGSLPTYFFRIFHSPNLPEVLTMRLLLKKIAPRKSLGEARL